METAVIVARFQVPVLIEPLKEIIDSILAKHKKVWCVLGEVATPGSKNNPLSAKAREAMLKTEFPQMNFIYLMDHPLDNMWSSNLDKVLRTNKVPSDAVIYGDTERFIKRYSGHFRVEVLQSEKRSAAFTQEEKPESKEFREGRVHAFQSSYSKVYPTVDVAVFRSNKTEVLLGKKNSNPRWRLIGGFVDSTDGSYENAAARELREEAGDLTTSEMIYEGSFKIDDWRYRYEEDKIISCLFSTDHLSGSATGSDDLAEVKWFTISELKDLADSDEIVAEHREMFEHLLKKYLL